MAKEIKTIVSRTVPAQRPTSAAQIQRSQSVSGSVPGKNAQPLGCDECNWTGYFRLDVPTSDPRFGKLQKCGCQVGIDQSRLQRLSGLSNMEMQNTLDDIDPAGAGTQEMVKAARGFVTAPIGILTIHGTPGNAKTAVLQGIVNELVRAGVEAVYITAFDIMGYIRSAFDSKHDVSDLGAYERLKRLERVRVLAIDELDKVRWTGFVEEQITDLIDVRWRSGTAGEAGTVIAMNNGPENLPSWIYSRMRDGRNQIIKNTDADMRPEME